MATRKQRKRREKEHRHEYVWIDEEGNEVDEPASAQSSNGSAKPRASGGGLGREAQAPSWRKSFKRGLIFAPIMLATVMLLSSELSFAQQVTQTLFIVSIFIPFSYFLDRMMYRSFQRRLAKSRSAGGKSGS